MMTENLGVGAEAVLLRRKAYAERGYRPVPVDRHGEPVGAAWREEAMWSPPRCTMMPVDPNTPYTALLLGMPGWRCETALVALVIKADDADLAADIVRLAQTRLTGLLRHGDIGEQALLYRATYSGSAPDHMRDWRADGRRIVVALRRHGAIPVELNPVSGEPYAWPGKRPDEVALTDLPEIDEERLFAAIEEALRSHGYIHAPDLLDEVTIEQVPPMSKTDDGPPGPSPPPPLMPPGGGGPRERRTIVIRGGQRHRAVEEGLDALREAGVPFYNRGGEIVRIERAPAKTSDGSLISVPVIKPVPLPALGRACGQAAHWQRISPKKKFYDVDPPWPVIEQIMTTIEKWPFPPLHGLTRVPTLRPDFSVLDRQGYDPETGLYADFGELDIPRIPGRPTRVEAETAVKLLLTIIDSFPVVDERSRATGVAAVMTPVVRGTLDVSPLYAISAPAPGTGKSYLVDCVAAIATGNRAAVVAMAPKDEETEKRLVGQALVGNPIICLDNVRRTL